jgi:hypothetical protein
VMTANQDLTATMMQPGSIPIPHPTTLQVIGLAWLGCAGPSEYRYYIVNLYNFKDCH